jgi:outer membrane biosynthesis protein TonB
MRILPTLLVFVCGACASATSNPAHTATPASAGREASNVSGALVGDPISDNEHSPSSSSGTLSRDAIRATVREHIDEIRGCYERVLENDPEDQGGRVVVMILIDPEGSVRNASVEESGFAIEGLHECITNQILAWTFPPPAGGGFVGVRYPFVFAPE